MENEVKKRKVWLDYARVFAILSISSNHAITRAFSQYQSSYEAYLAMPFIGSVFRAIIFVFSRMGVPIFLMITGSLLLKKKFKSKDDILNFYRHNLGRLFITSEIWAFISFWFTVIFIHQEVLAKGFFYVLVRCIGSLLFINRLSVTSMWYIPMILCVYMILPFVSIVINKFSGKYLLIPYVIVFISTMVIPNINMVFAIKGWNHSLEFGLSSANLFSMYLLYVLAGYYISKRQLCNISTIRLLAETLLFFVLSCVYQSWEYTVAGDHRIGYNFAFLAIGSVLLFECFRRFVTDTKESRVVTYLSKISFGIYLVHIYVMTIMIICMVHFGVNLNPILSFLMLEAGSICASIVIIGVLSKAEVFKKYLFMIKD